MNLQKQPVPLLGALNLKTSGRAPTEFADTLVPTFDTRDFYLFDLLISQTNTIMATTAADSLGLNVAAGYAWRVRAVSLEILLETGTAAPDGVHLDLGISYRGFTSTVAQLSTPPVAAVAADTRFCCGTPLDVVLPPGSLFLGRNGSTLSAASLLRATVFFQAITL